MADKRTFQLKIEGKDVSPETVSVGDLVDLMSNLEAAILQSAPSGGFPVAADEAVMSLVRVEENCNKLTFAIIESAALVVGTITAAIEGRKFDQLPTVTHEKLHAISKQMIRKGWSAEFLSDGPSGIRAAAISPMNPVPPPTPAKVKGPTTVWGRLMRVGGAKPRGELRLSTGELLYFDLDQSMARQIRDGLYEDVSVDGIATWLVEDRKLVDFEATRVTGYRPEQTSLLKAFEELAAASKGHWDGVDVVQYVHDLRSEA